MIVCWSWTSGIVKPVAFDMGKLSFGDILHLQPSTLPRHSVSYRTRKLGRISKDFLQHTLFCVQRVMLHHDWEVG